MAFHHEASNATLLKLLSFLFWSWSYLWCAREVPRHDPEWYSRVITLLHGSIATLAGISQCGITSLSPCKLTMKISPSYYALMLWSWGYFAFDLLWCIIYCPKNYVMLFHHASALIGINMYMGKDYTGCTFACTLALMEVTNPLLQTRWFLRDGGYNKTVIYYFVEITYLLMFLSLRGFLCTYLMYKIFMSELFDMDEKMISLALYIVSIVFVYEILGYVFYKYKGSIQEFSGFANETISGFNETR